MKKAIQMLGLGMAGLMTWFSPMQITHGVNSCCAECVLKKEDEIDSSRRIRRRYNGIIKK